MKNTLLLILIFLASFFIAACQDATGPESQPQESGNSFMFVDSTDTLFIWGSVYIEFEAKIDSANTLDSLELFIDEKRHSVVYEENVSRFQFISIHYPTGTYTLKFVLHSSSDNGTPARQFVEEFSRPVVINNDPPAASEILLLEPVDGKLQFEWTEYKVFNFQEYRIESKTHTGWRDVAIITDSETTIWRHPYFVAGDNVVYRVVVKAADKEAASQSLSPLDTDPLLYPVEITDSYGLNFSWRRSPFDSTFVRYRLQAIFGNTVGGDLEDFATINDIDSTEFSLPNPIFGAEITFVLKTESTKQSFHSNSENVVTLVGEQTNIHRSLHHIPQSDRLFMYYFNTTIEFEASTMDSVNTYQFAPYFSEDASLAYRRKAQGQNVENNKYFYSINPTTLQDITEFNTFNFVGYNSYIGGSRLHPDNTGRVWYTGFTYQAPTLYFDKVFLINTNTGAVDVEHESEAFISEVSADGNYIVLYSPSPAMLYHFDGNELLPVKNVGRPENFKFHPDNQHFVVVENQKLRLYDLETLSVVSEVSLPESSSQPNIDLFTGYVGSRDIGAMNGRYTYRIMDFNTGELKKQFDTVKDASYQMINGKLFSSRGFYLPLELE